MVVMLLQKNMYKKYKDVKSENCKKYLFRYVVMCCGDDVAKNMKSEKIERNKNLFRYVVMVAMLLHALNASLTLYATFQVIADI